MNARIIRLIAPFAFLLLATAGRAQTTFTWIGQDDFGDVVLSGNWSDGQPSGDGLTLENVIFGDATQTTVVFDGQTFYNIDPAGPYDFILHDLSFTSTTAPYVFQGVESVDPTGYFPSLILTGDVNVSAVNSNPVTIDSSLKVTLANDGTDNDHTISVVGGSSVDIQTDLGETDAGASISKTGAGTLVIGGNTSYTGGTIVHDGLLDVDGGGINHSAADFVAGSANGDSATVTISNGGSISNFVGTIGDLAGSSGAVVVDGAGSSWTNADRLNVGNFGSGTLDILNGATVSANRTYIGVENGSNSLVTVDGAGSTFTNTGALTLGYSGSGTLLILNGGTVTNSSAQVGLAFAPGNSSLVYVDGAGSTWTSPGGIIVGNGGTGAVTLANGGKTVIGSGFGTLTLAYTSSSNGTLNIGAAAGDTAASGGILNATNVTSNGSNAFLQFNTTGTALDPYFFTRNGTSSGPQITVGGLTQIINNAGYNVITGNNAYTGFTDNVVINGGTLQIGSGGTTGSVAGNIVNNSALAFDRSNDSTYAGVISGSGTVNKAGGGVLTLSGTNTYSGNTTIREGAINAANDSALGTGNVTLEGGTLLVDTGTTVSNSVIFGKTGGSIGGKGTFGSLITTGFGATLAPGNSVGTLNFSGGLELGAGGTLEFEVMGANDGSGALRDLLAVDGAIAGPGTSIDITANSDSPFVVRLISLDDLGNAGNVSDFDSGLTYSWLLATTTNGISGFDPNSFAVDVSAFTNDLGIGMFSVDLIDTNLVMNFSPVPEPSTWLLLGGGLAALGLGWRRRRRAS